MPRVVPRDDDLTPTLLTELRNVRLSVNGEASLVGADATDPATMDWWGRATLMVWTDDERAATSGPWYDAAGVAMSAREADEGGREFDILHASGLIVDLWRVEDVVDALDARSSDYEHFAPVFADRGRFGETELHPELEEMLEPGGSRVVIVDRVRLAPAWRGLGGVGRLLVARLLSWVCDDPRTVVTHPFPIDLDEVAREDAATFDSALEQVRRTWRSLAFQPWLNDIWVMDPRKRAHGEAVERIAKGLGV